MSLNEKTPAIYRITNKLNGKVYIGSSKDVTKRFKQWIYTINQAENGDTKLLSNPLVADIVKYGWDNFEFKIIDSSADMMDPEIRSIREVEMIMKYRSISPEFGYNSTMGGESGSLKHRKYPSKFKNTKPKSTFVYDIKTDNIYIFLKGTKYVHEFTGCKRTAIPDAIQRGKLIKGRYFLFYVNTERRKMFAEYITDARSGLKTNGSNGNIADTNYRLYMKALNAVNKFAKDCGFK